jgi:drug/metabolite transporter (DMT)-like permease
MPTMPPTASTSVSVSRTRIGADPRLILSLLAVYVIWGSTYYAMRVAVEGLPPLLMAATRFVPAGLILLGIARMRGAAWPTARQWAMSLPIGMLWFVGGNGFIAIALQSIDSGVTAVAVATMPLWAAVMAAGTGERPGGREWLGLGFGFAGVVVLVGGVSVHGEPLHVVLLLLSPVSWAAGSILSRRLPLPAGGVSAALPLITGGAALGVVAVLRGEWFVAGAPAEAWLAVTYLMVMGSLVAFSAFHWLLHHATPSVATSYAYVNPVIAVLIGGAIGGEVLGPSTLIATGLIVAAVALVVTAKRRT